MEPLLLPVGHDVGVFYSAGADGRRVQQVRAGMSLVELGDPEYVVWLLAHGIDNADRPTRASLTARAGQLELDRADADVIVSRLVADGLLAELDPDAETAVDFARTHQLVPLLMGLGPGDDGLQTIGMFDQPLAQVSGAVYDVWAWSHLTPQLWVGCQDAAEVARRVGVTAPEEIEARSVLSGILHSVHGLLCVRAAYLDRREAQ